MILRAVNIGLLFCLLGFELGARNADSLSIQLLKKEIEALPDDIVNVPFFITNNHAGSLPVDVEVDAPGDWRLVTKTDAPVLKPREKKFMVFSIQVPSGTPVGRYPLVVEVRHTKTGEPLASGEITIGVKEVEKISLQLIESPENILAGETYRGHYLLQNQGNTEKRVFLETTNCRVEGDAEVRLEPGETKKVTLVKPTSVALTNTKKEYVKLRALLSGEVQESVFRPLVIFPVKKSEKDLFFRFPVNAAATYLAARRGDSFEGAYQFELSGNGSLDPEGKHRLQFLARGPNSANLSFLGMYDQYFLSYSNKNLEISLGQKAYHFTPLTEASRFGTGIENRIILNNGLSFGFIYVKPRFFQEISNEWAFFSGFEKDKYNRLEVFFIQKKNAGAVDPIYLGSVNTAFQLFDKTTLELEASRGYFGEEADNAFRGNLNSRFSIFSVAGDYFYTGKNYPGYYSNSTFYSGSFSARPFPKMNLGVYAREDFSNARLDTFFVTAPYMRSLQSFVNFNVAPQAFLKIYWRDTERKDRLDLQKFHFQTRSFNGQFRQKINRLEYRLQGEYGKTINYLQEEQQQEKNTYRGTIHLGYRFNPSNGFRVFGSWSNINSFVSEEQRNLTAGLSLHSRIFENLKANFHLQNAYNIDEYYRNRNLMQLNLDYTFLKNHSLAFRGYYTLFRRATKDPELFFSATYTCKLGVPLKQVIKAGDVKGRLTDDEGNPVPGIVMNLLDRASITDKAGVFEFRSVPPGVHLLTIDRSRFEMDEIPGIPTPIRVEVLEDQVTPLNFRIIKGAKLTGKFVFPEKEGSRLNNEPPSRNNIVIELRSDFRQYRITSGSNGEFSFPLVLPGEWVLKVYENSVPEGFALDKTTWRLDLKPGEEKTLQVVVKPKKRNIIFKPGTVALSNRKKGALSPLKKITKLKTSSSEKDTAVYYTVQIGAFSKELSPDSPYFKGKGFDFEKRINNLHKYFIGHFKSFEKAVQKREELKSDFKGAFVIAFKNGKVIYINDQ